MPNQFYKPQKEEIKAEPRRKEGRPKNRDKIQKSRFRRLLSYPQLEDIDNEQIVG